MSLISTASTDLTLDASDSNSITFQFHANKRPGNDKNAPASRFKGVVGQQNGHWGAQIYANHQRIWLGTFKSEMEAAMAYDSAAIKLRSGDSYRNFPWTSINVQEPSFQSQFSIETVLNMIKDGSYPSKFNDFLRLQFENNEIEAGLSLVPVDKNGGFLGRQLFQKELTPSDVGKLNRLVIPKKYALKYFPHISEGVEETEGNGGLDVQLTFFDRLMRSWKFRYCYWKSSQSFVFTRGWNRFVKEKELKAKDMIIFSVCQCNEGPNKGGEICVIDVCYNDVIENNGGFIEDIVEDLKFEEAAALERNVGENSGDGNDEKEIEEDKKLVGVGSADGERKGLRLFGVQIF